MGAWILEVHSGPEHVRLHLRRGLVGARGPALRFSSYLARVFCLNVLRSSPIRGNPIALGHGEAQVLGTWGEGTHWQANVRHADLTRRAHKKCNASKFRDLGSLSFPGSTAFLGCSKVTQGIT